MSDGDIKVQPEPARLEIGLHVPRVGVRQYLEGELLWAARLAAHHCRQREHALLKAAFSVVDY